MNKPGNRKSIYFTLGGLLFFAIPFYYMAYWFYCAISFSKRDVAVETYKNALPEFMRAGGSINFIFVFLAMAALVLAAKGISNRNPYWHKLSMLITIVSGLLAFLYLFQMM